MCSHYQALKAGDRYRRHFGAEPPEGGAFDVWPGYSASFIRRHEQAAVGDEAVPPVESLTGVFGLVPHWAADLGIGRRTYNARSETVAEKPSFRDAWRRARHCIIPADAFYEPDWSTGRAVPTRISRADGEPLGIAGLWASWRAPGGEVVFSFTMLTINAEAHPLMRRFHKPADEKRMVVILPEASYGEWLRVPVADSQDFLRAYPAEGLVAAVDERRTRL